MKTGSRPLTRMEQYLETRRAFRGVTITRSGIALPLRPTPVSPTYRVRVDYVPEQRPRVFVVTPALVPAAKHTFADGSLCLYYKHGYDNTMSFVDTIVPWTAHWLFCYEIWQVQGTWPAAESTHGGPK